VKVELPPEQIDCVPDIDGVGFALLVKTTSSLLLVQDEVSVQRKVTELPAATETLTVAEVGVVIMAEPLTTVHKPVAPDTVFPVTENVVLPLQRDMSLPAFAFKDGHP